MAEGLNLNHSYRERVFTSTATDVMSGSEMRLFARAANGRGSDAEPPTGRDQHYPSPG